MPLLYGVPRIRKLRAVGPHTSSSHSRLDSNPPDATTKAFAAISTGPPSNKTVALSNNPSRHLQSDDLGVIRTRIFLDAAAA